MGFTLSFVVCACLFFQLFLLALDASPYVAAWPFFFHQIAHHQSHGVSPVIFNVIVSSS